VFGDWRRPAPDSHWWTNERRVQNIGAKGIVITVDNQYLSDRDRNNQLS
jgi:hypothetical protein